MTFRIRHVLVLTSLLSVLGSLPLAAQGDDVFLDPNYLLPTFIGIDVGYTFWKNQASFAVSDQAIACAVFGDTEGKGPAFGGKAFLYINPWFFVSPRARYETRSATFVSPLPGEPVRDAANEETVLSQEAQTDLTMSSITLDLRAGVDFFEWGLYICAGPSFNLMLDASYDYSERILGPAGFLYTDSRSTEHVLASARTFDNFQSFGVDARGGIGYLLQFGRLAINPEVFYSYPLTSSLKDPDKLKQAGISGSLGILFNFGE